MNSEKYKEGKSVIETYYFVKKDYAESRSNSEKELKENKAAEAGTSS